MKMMACEVGTRPKFIAVSRRGEMRFENKEECMEYVETLLGDDPEVTLVDVYEVTYTGRTYIRG